MAERGTHRDDNHPPPDGGGDPSALSDCLTKGPDRVIRPEWAGGIPEEMATLPQLRLGRRWVPFRKVLGFLVVAGAVCAVSGILLARHLRTLPSVQAFIAKHPGTGSFGPEVTTGFPWWLRYQHYFNLILMLFIIRSGLQILADHPRLTFDAGCKPVRSFFACAALSLATGRGTRKTTACPCRGGWAFRGSGIR
jgi:hypothetical protein